GEEVHVAGDRCDAERGGGRLDHRAEGRTFRARERLERGIEQYAHLADVLLQRDHRNQDADVLLLREPEECGKLSPHQLRILEQEAHAAPSERGVGLEWERQEWHGLVCAVAESTDSDGHTLPT